ncbi:MAG: hypothetical protein U1E76_04255 [Planctomycetota bacterium]
MPASVAPLVLEPIVRTLCSAHAPTREAATLALGLLGSPRAVPVLAELLQDSARAHAELLHSADRQSDLVRPFAAIALGLIGAKDAFAPLRAAIENPDGSLDLQVCAISALGLLGEEEPEVSAYLAGLLHRHDLAPVAQAQVPVAIGRRGTASRILVGALLELATSQKTLPQTRRSCVIALGQAASLDQVEVMRALQAIAVGDADQASCNFAWIALAEIAARDRAFEMNGAAHQAFATLLAAELDQPSTAAALPWVALASGICTRAQPRVGPLLPLGRAYRSTSNPSYKAAGRARLGLAGLKSSADELIRDWRASRDRTFQGHVAIALGLLRAAGIADDLVALAVGNGLDWRCRLSLSHALAMLGSTQLVPSLLGELESTSSLADAIGIGFALGAMRDRSALPVLSAIMQDHKRISMQRDYAALAIGLCADRADLPQRARVLAGMNYQALTPALTELIRVL